MFTMRHTPQAEKSTSSGNFILICIAGYLFSIAYGVTFLLPLLIITRGGDEAIAGNIISVATISTVAVVVLSGHIADWLGAARSAALSGLFLFTSSLGFAYAPGTVSYLTLFGLILGVGWGVFYTLGPILVAAIVTAERRSHCFALLSGSMMAGIGTGPIIGRIWAANGFSIEGAFLSAGIASLFGTASCFAADWKLTAEGKVIKQRTGISYSDIQRILRSRSAFPIFMVCLGGAIFGGLSSFQKSYAAERGLDYSLYFLGFMATAICSRLFLSGYVVRRAPLIPALALTSITGTSILMFIALETSSTFYILASVTFGLGYGLTYSVINGQAANDAPEGLVPQSLLLFSLAYFIGVFGFPFVAGHLIVFQGIVAMLYTILALAALNTGVVVFQLLLRR